jgi:hypothetical protein
LMWGELLYSWSERTGFRLTQSDLLQSLLLLLLLFSFESQVGFEGAIGPHSSTFPCLYVLNT